MFERWNKKQSLKAILCFAAFFVLVLATQLPGFLSPLYWCVFPVFSAFVAAGPVTCLMDMKPGFGSAAALPLLWFIVYRCVGEISMPLMWVFMFGMMALAEVLSKAGGYDKKLGMRLAVPAASLVPMGNLIPLFFTKPVFLERAAAEEMDPSYIAGLDKYGTIGMFMLVIVLAIVTASISERITERIVKTERV